MGVEEGLVMSVSHLGFSLGDVAWLSTQRSGRRRGSKI